MNGLERYGNYINDEGVTIKVTTDKRGTDHISYYEDPVDGDHSVVHLDVDYDDNKWRTVIHKESHSDSKPGSGS